MTHEPIASGRGWARYSETAFTFRDDDAGILINLRNAKRDDGHVYADLHAFIDLWDGNDPQRVLTRGKVNLTTDRSSALKRDLAKLDDLLPEDQRERVPLPWDDLLERIAAVMVEQMDRRGVLSKFERMDGARLATPMAFKGMLPLNRLSGLTAHGGEGKSLIAMIMALSVATGLTIGPFEPLIQGPVLYIDWEEEDNETGSRRLTRLCDGLGIDVPDNLYHYRAFGRLDRIEDDLITHAYDLGVVFTPFDSLGFALAGQSMNDSETATIAIQSMKRLPATKLIIEHISKERLKDGADARLGGSGSAFFWNGVRSQYSLQAEESNDPDVKLLILRHDKSNLAGRNARPWGLRIDFDGDSGPITVARFDVEAGGLGEKALTKVQRILDIIRRFQAEKPTLELIAEELGVPTRPAANLDALVAKPLRDLERKGAIVRIKGRQGDWYAIRVHPRGGPEDEMPRCAKCHRISTGYLDTGEGVCDTHLRD